MDQERVTSDSTSHSFIVKVTIQETTAEAGHVIWRGSISHVPDDTRRYFKDLQTMADFVGEFIEAMGGNAGFGYRLRKKIRRAQRMFHTRFWTNKGGWFR